MDIPFIRPARKEDLDQLILFSEEAGAGITSLPRNPKVLEEKVSISLQSFKELITSPKPGIYLFSLDLGGEVIGTSAILSRIGMESPFFAYRLLKEKQKCPPLNIDREIDVLHLIRARKKPTEIGTLFLSRLRRGKHLGKLLSLSRFLFIATFRSRFADTVIGELRGVNQNGVSPFWEAVGRPFFDLTFEEADHLRSEHPEAIGELFPAHPIYLKLLSQEARDVISQPHPFTLPAKWLLEKQGFQMSSYLDLFDAGPHVFAPTDEIKGVRESQVGVVKELRSTLEGEKEVLVSNQKADFRACIAPLLIEHPNKITLSIPTGRALDVDIGDPVRYFNL